MNRTSLSVFIFGIYTFIMGGVLFFIPQLVLPVFNLPVNGQPWLSLLGFVLICSAYYYIRAAKNNHLAFAVYTTHTRLTAPFAVGILIAMGKADWHMAAFGLVDGLAGLWTLYELKRTPN